MDEPTPADAPVVVGDPHRVIGADERRHRRGAPTWWNESYYADFVQADTRLAGYVRWGFVPNVGVSWWTAAVVGPGRPAVVAAHYDLPCPEPPDLALVTDEVSVRLQLVTALGDFAVAARSPARILAAPADAYTDDPGAPTTLACDLRWSTDGVPYRYAVTDRYEIPCTVRGQVTVGDERIEVDGAGQRDHSWGERDWWSLGWCWFAARLEDGTRLHVTVPRLAGLTLALGYVQEPGAPVVTVLSAHDDVELDDDGLARRAHLAVEPGGWALDLEPLGWGPLRLTDPDGRVSRFPRAAVSVRTADGRRGTGWVEWNQPQAAD